MSKLDKRKQIIVAASAMAAAAAASAWELEHRRVQRADLTESHLRVERLSDLKDAPQALAAVDAGLRSEWGEFALLGFESIDELLAEAGKTIYVVVERDAGGETPRGIVQTILVDAHGDASLLRETFPSFQTLTSRESWKRSRSKGGDTAVLLQITTLGESERGAGLGSMLRSAVLNMIDKHVGFALTMTPVDGAGVDTVDPDDAQTYTPAMRFHARGGATPALVLPGFKTGSPESQHGSDIVVMRYERSAEGHWPEAPEMKLRSMGPMEERVTRAIRGLHLRRLRSWRLRRPTLPSLRLHRRRVHA